jgi:2-methylisocitrate lyase-like PEP mutase family enzyme
MTTLAEHCKRIAAIGGSSKSAKKIAASRRNARKPRPNAKLKNAIKRAEKLLKNK